MKNLSVPSISISAHSELLEALSVTDRALLIEHLQGRMQARQSRVDLRIVYDILNKCNLRCEGCSTAPSFVPTNSPLPGSLSPSGPSIMGTIDALEDFTRTQSLRASIVFGGGEPFLRADLPEIARRATRAWGPANVGVDTNGNVRQQAAVIEALLPSLGYLGVSVDGPEIYHDQWRGVLGSYRRAVSLLSDISGLPGAKRILEVTSVATTNNLQLLPLLVRTLAGFGVANYSVHRAMPVGRMHSRQHLIPSAAEYLHLTIDLIKACNAEGVNFHIHHTLESIYASLLLQVDTRVDSAFGNPDQGSSIGITPDGRVVYDPWSMRRPWRTLRGGPMSSALLERALQRPKIATDIAHLDAKCHGCPVPCSGGSRIAAAVEELSGRSVSPPDLLISMETARDPACPLDQAL